MFSAKKYYEVNREERHYCALYIHTLLSAAANQERFLTLLGKKTNTSIDPIDIEIYLEVAALRDYWYELGDYDRDYANTHQKRLQVIKGLLQGEGLDESLVDQHDFFWTTKQKKKLWYPGKWSKTALKEAGLNSLISLTWAFNAKPDIGIVSGDQFYLIECKLESLEGFNNQTDVEYRQYEVQEQIARLIERFCPAYKNVYLSKLSIGEKDGITWKEALDCIDFSKIDSFSKKLFETFKQRYFK